MKIKQFDRVIYQNNPLVEVVCQVTFRRNAAIEGDRLAQLRDSPIGQDYPVFESNEQAAVQVIVGDQGKTEAKSTALPTLFHMSSADGEWKISVCSDYLALSARNYLTWNEFLPRFRLAFQNLTERYGFPSINRVGLRYRDVIERETIGLAGVRWSDLLSDFVLGPIGANKVEEESAFAEHDVQQHNSQSLIRFAGTKVLLQAGLLYAVEDSSRHAFMLDSDFHEQWDGAEDPPRSEQELDAVLDNLHGNAGALFRACIKEKLHDALGPTPA